MIRRIKSKKLSEILIENKLITPAILEDAVEHQRKFGGNITQYLISYNYVSEEDIVKSVSNQLGVPYLPLQFYKIPKGVIKMVPVDIALKHWLMPVDMIKNIITVVMLDPLDDEAIKEVEKVTGCDVQAFVGRISDIVRAIEQYYDIFVDDRKLKAPAEVPFFIDTKIPKGFDLRRSIRIKARIDVHFPFQELYKKSTTKNISRHGFLFESDSILPVGSYIILEIDIPQEFSASPLAAVVQVVRISPLGNNRFDIGVSLIKMAREDIDTLIRYANSKV
ncbi:MAG: PilZ domain-containing protein [Candidatus Omnitrophota bacterium]